MLKNVLFLSCALFGFLTSFCQPKHQDSVKLLVNLNRLTTAERLAFIKQFKEYILAPEQSGSRKKIARGETLDTIIHTAYGIDQGNPLLEEYVNRIAAINNLTDKNAILADETIQLPATLYKSPLASETQGVITTSATSPKLSGREKQNLDSIANIAKTKSDYRITLLKYKPYATAATYATALSNEVYDYLQKKGKINPDHMVVREAGYNPASCISCNAVGVHANWVEDIYKSARSSPELWVGRPQLSYQLDYTNAANLVFDVSADDFAKIVSGETSPLFFALIDSNKLSFTQSSINRVAEIGLLETDAPGRYGNYLPEKLSVDLSILDTADFGKYYIFDVFKAGQCLHGRKVYEVVKEVLAAYNLTRAISMVDSVPINYFSNRRECDSLYTAYTLLDGKDGLDKNVTPYNNSPVDSVTFAQYAGDDRYSPETYLSAINTLFIRKVPSIISSCFTAGCSGTILTPSISSDSLLQNINFIAAATNENDTIEKYRKPRAKNLNDPHPYTEPLLSYMASLPNLGTIIVGDELTDTNYAGNYSAQGNNITCLGQGTNWGGPERCIRPWELGTSFATPEVAANLFIAKAWWRKNKVPMTSIEARRRLILSTNLNQRFIGKFASSGMISLNKLLQTSRAYLVTATNEIIPIDTIAVSTIEYHMYSPFDQMKFGDFQGTDDHSLRGLYCVNDKFYIFNENDGEKWASINQLYKLNVGCFIKGKFTPIYQQDFPAKYKQLVILKP